MSDVDVDRDEDSPQPQHNTLNNVGSPVKHYQHHNMEDQVNQFIDVKAYNLRPVMRGYRRGMDVQRAIGQMKMGKMWRKSRGKCKNRENNNGKKS